MTVQASWLLEEIRENIAETTASYWTNAGILRKLNAWQRRLWAELTMSPGEWLTKKSSALTPSSSQITLPSDCAKPLYLENSDGYIIDIGLNLRDQGLTKLPGTSLSIVGNDAYLLGNTLMVNQDDFSDNCYLWYTPKCIDLHTGVAASGSGASALVFEVGNDPQRVDDYYNNQYVTVLLAGGTVVRSLISDYAGSTATATITGTVAANDVYGTETQLPDLACDLMVIEATMQCLARPGVDIGDQAFQYWNERVREARSNWRQWISDRIPGAHRVRTTEIQ